MGVHRKEVRRFHESGDFHLLTFGCYRRMPLLEEDGRRRMLATSVDRAMVGQGFRLVAFVFMPEHVHLLAYPTAPDPRLDLLLKAIKGPFSFRVKQQLASDRDPLLGDLTVRERPGVTRFRFWQEGGGHDRNLRGEAAVVAAIDYIHLNPVRRGLCDCVTGWRWSSARRYHGPEGDIDPGLPTVDGPPPDLFAGGQGPPE